MDTGVQESQIDFHRLDGAYRDAWKRFCVEVKIWRSLLLEKAESIAIKQAENRVALAERYYRENRNELAEYILARSARANASGGLAFTGREVSDTSGPLGRRFSGRAQLALSGRDPGNT